MIKALIVLAVGCRAFPTLLECARPLEPGETIMSSTAEFSDARIVTFERDGESLACGSTYVPDETLSVVLSDGGGRQMYEVTGGTLFFDGCDEYTGTDSDGTAEAAFCVPLGFSRCAKVGSDSHPVRAPSDGSELTAKVGFAGGFGTVSITGTCTLFAPEEDTTMPSPMPTVMPSTVMPTGMPSTAMPSTMMPSTIMPTTTMQTTAMPSMVPTASPSASPKPTFMPTEEPGTIVDIALATDSLSTLVIALTATNLTDTLSSEGPFTVFAPTNDAFDDLPEGTLETLLNDTETLSDILLYHVVSDEFLSRDLDDGMVVETVLGSSFTILFSGGVQLIFETGNASVITPDIRASNGIIHLIDTVLIPPTDSCTDSTAWYKRGDTSKDCAWVANHPPRCGVKGFDTTLASYACPAACGTSCDDSTSWYKNGDPSKDCAWVHTFTPKRCAVIGVDGVPASEACLTSCPSD